MPAVTPQQPAPPAVDDEPLVLPPMGDWVAQAGCVGADTNLFFSDRPADQSAALQVCADCPVRADCAEWAVPIADLAGVWGAMTVAARRAERRRQRPPDVPRSQSWRAAERARLISTELHAGVPPTVVAARAGVTVRTVQRWRARTAEPQP